MRGDQNHSNTPHQTSFNNNRDYIFYNTLQLLTNQFKHLKIETIQNFIYGLFTKSDSHQKILEHCQNFIIQIKQVQQ